MANIEETILSQYSCSPRIMALAHCFYDNQMPWDNIALFYQKIFDIDTASDIGLDIWGRIVGIKRNASMVTKIGVPHFGFTGPNNHNSSNATGFNQAAFYHGADKVNFTLSDDAYRLYIKTKAMANICDGSFTALNNMLKTLLPHCDVRLTRVGPLHVKLVCSGELSDYEKNMLLSGEMPPIPSGVTLDVELNNTTYFGFNTEHNTGFNQGPFAPSK